MFDYVDNKYFSNGVTFGRRSPEPVYFAMTDAQIAAIARREKWLLTDEQRQAIKDLLRPEIRAEIIAELSK